MTTPNNPAALPPSSQAADVGLPSQGVRTTVNFLLFVHLFSLGALWLFNGSEMGLRQQLRRVPGYYLQLLGMDVDFDSGQRFNWDLQARDRKMLQEEGPLDFRARMAQLRQNLLDARGNGRIHKAEMDWTALNEMQKQNPRILSRRGLYHLTQGDALDVGHFLEFRYTREGQEHVVGLPGFRRGSSGKDDVAALPAVVGWQGFWPRQRYVRYQVLAREIGRLAGTENVQDILPAAITEGILRSEGIALEEVGEIKAKLFCRRLTTRGQDQVLDAREPTADDSLKDPWNVRWFVTAYQKVPVAVGGKVRFGDTSGLQRDYTPAVSEPVEAKTQP